MSVFKAGDTFLITDPGGRTEHLRVVLTDPWGTPPVVITVQLNTATILSDTTTVLQPGDHPFCRRTTVVSYDTLLEMRVELLTELELSQQMVRDPYFVRKEPCSTALLQRIIDGAFRSPMTTPRMRRALEQALNRPD